MVIIAINLFAVRIILKVLGIEDYGIYNVVGGIVTLFSFLGSSLSSGAQRFFAYEDRAGRLQSVTKSFQYDRYGLLWDGFHDFCSAGNCRGVVFK